jgi:hypothetical protein
MGYRNVVMLNISHHLFMNGTLIFCEANPDHLCYLRALFLSLKIVSSLKINLSKLGLVHVANNVDGLASILGCRVSSLLLNILVFRWNFFKSKSI